MVKRYLCVVVCVVCSALASGCGYALAGRGSFLPDYIQTIGVPPFANRTNVFNLETLLTQKVQAEFIGRGKYKILPESTGVDAVLTGEVTSASLVPVSFTPGQLASRYAFTLSARVELRDLRENRTIWENSALIFRQEYEAQSGASPQDPGAFFGQDTNALDRMSSDFARTIVSAILEAF
jgi:Lipopolysaccharide-assembly